ALPEGHRSNLLVIRASLTCQGCSRSILSGIYPVRTQLPLSPTLSPSRNAMGRGRSSASFFDADHVDVDVVHAVAVGLVGDEALVAAVELVEDALAFLGRAGLREAGGE